MTDLAVSCFYIDTPSTTLKVVLFHSGPESQACTWNIVIYQNDIELFVGKDFLDPSSALDVACAWGQDHGYRIPKSMNFRLKH